MNTNRKIAIDKYIGYPLALILNVLARIFGFFLRIDHSLNKSFKTIVVSKYAGMGSIIQATPLLQTLRKNYPDAHLIFVSNSSNKTLLEYMPFVDEIISINDNSFFKLFTSVMKLLLRLWKRKADVYIDLEIYSNLSSIITTLSLATNRLGFFKSEKNYKFGLFTHMMYFNPKAPVSEVYLQFARLLGCKDPVTALYKFNLSQPGRDAGEKAISTCGISTSEKYLVINPNASDLRLERRWPAKNFVELINLLLKDKPDYKIVLIGGRSEKDYVSSIASQTNTLSLINTSGKLSLGELMLLIENSDLLITNDTGPMHIAFAQQTKTVALFGPCSPIQYGQSANSSIIYKNIYCSPCVHEFFVPPCKGNNQCMKLISVPEVLFAIDSALNDIPVQNINTGIIYESELTLGQVLRT